ncbi:nitrite reductase (NAD(P)H) small subunit [Vibrio sinensis]|uniref:Nitrite reductase (NAD(P)H) small subunit n=1 Tax=Vibrio sinensis TaxID=2302434 RepID=A0A3A6R3H5_9VIBR|nr:nitrite reductase small subunit NirD [Vibrio sinensis]RJX71449.1 nitrite reductase (NAD(P)H) small subunit [Vibrio sinensis]
MTLLTNVIICKQEQLTPWVGATALVNNEQVALFYIPNSGIYAVQDWDPIGKAYVMSRGIVGDIDGELCIASPLYKQHFSLKTGRCFEDDKYSLRVWPITVKHGHVCLILEE